MKQRIASILLILFKVVTDIFIIDLSFILSFVVKFKLITVHSNTSIEPYRNVLFFITVLWLLSFVIVGLYKERKGLLPEVDEVFAVFNGVLMGIVMITAFSFFYKDFPGSRWVVFYTWMISFFLLSVSRLTIFYICKLLKKSGYMNKNALIIGVDILGQSIATKIVVDPICGYSLIGFLADELPKEVSFHMKNKINILGKILDYKKVIEDKKINTVFIALPQFDNSKLLEIASYCIKNNIDLKTVPNLFDLMSSSVDISDLDGIPLISLKEFNLTPLNSFFKRFFDLFVSIIIVILLSPIFMVIALAVKFTSNGPILYRQKRVGKDGKPFIFLKFRSMGEDAEEKTGPVLAQDKDDPRLTKIGKFLRSTSLDELPQFFNIIMGDMSLVGPRPERPYFVEKYSKEIPNFAMRQKVKGGLTGWAQVNGRGELTVKPAEKLRYDLYYIENWSLLFDIKIIFKTIFLVITRKHVY